MRKKLNKYSKMKFAAINDYVQIEPMEVKKETRIALAEMTKKKVAKARVLSVGEGRILLDGTKVEIPLKAGDIILFNPHLIQEVEDEKGMIFIINASAIYGKYGSK